MPKSRTRCLSLAVGLILLELPIVSGDPCTRAGKASIVLIWRPATSKKTPKLQIAPRPNDKAIFGMTRFVFPSAWLSHLD